MGWEGLRLPIELAGDIRVLDCVSFVESLD